MLKKPLTSFQIIILGFLTFIIIGTLLLMLPIATQARVSTPFIEALFTATSAVCVTGLIVHDTATYWSSFGQAVILLLIQVGGMGIVTFSVAVSMFTGKKIGLHQRQTMQDSISAPQVGGIVKLTGFIIKTALLIEFVGACFLSIVFCGEFGVGKGIWYSFFHSISAFCNAGFDLMGAKEQYSSLTSFSDNALVNVIIMLLIIFGGIGFLTWNDIKEHSYHIKKYRMQSKVIFTVSAILIFLPAIYFFFGEFSGGKWEQLPLGERILCSFFQSVTTRTAGFNTAEFIEMSECGIAISTALMLIGGSPGSTAGGIKTTTVAVLVLASLAVFRRSRTVDCFGRRISLDSVRYASTVFVTYFTLFLTGGLIISKVENLPVLYCLFESASAIGTVGLTLGITPELGLVSRIILILLMFFGRVGGLTLVFAALSGNLSVSQRYPEEKITVG